VGGRVPIPPGYPARGRRFLPALIPLWHSIESHTVPIREELFPDHLKGI
jgi:hypothetical protein